MFLIDKNKEGSYSLWDLDDRMLLAASNHVQILITLLLNAVKVPFHLEIRCD